MQIIKANHNHMHNYMQIIKAETGSFYAWKNIYFMLSYSVYGFKNQNSKFSWLNKTFVSSSFTSFLTSKPKR